MKREIITPQGKSCITILFPLGEKDSTSAQKLDAEELQPYLNDLAKELKCEYAVRLNNGVATAEIVFSHTGKITDQDEHDYEVKAINFMSEVDKLELPKPEPIHDAEDAQEERFEDNVPQIEFVRTLLNDINREKGDPKHVIGADIIEYGPDFFPFPIPWGRMSRNLLKEMCTLYLKYYEQDN